MLSVTKHIREYRLKTFRN